MNIPLPLLNDSSDEDNRKNHRRSKNDNEGRTYKCETCGKAYLSYPALYTHIKTKHDVGGKGNKGRGRPKKDNYSPENTMRMMYNPLSFDYFKHPERTGETLIERLDHIFNDVFNEVFINLRNVNEYNSNHIKLYEDIRDYTLFHKIIDYYQEYNQNIINKVNNNLLAFNTNNNLDENSKCDDVLAFYLFKVARNAKEECFEKVLRFVVLFRECLNYIYKDTIVNKTNDSIVNKEFSEEFTCEDAPDISNEFILEFLQTDQMIMGYSKEEAIDLTQNLCQWLYDNNFTCSKLSLINNS